jgi:hypothetical protein
MSTINPIGLIEAQLRQPSEAAVVGLGRVQKAVLRGERLGYKRLPQVGAWELLLGV